MRIGLFAVWLAAIGAGLAALALYQSRAGTIGVTPTQWPSQSSLSRASAQPTLIMFAHPRCPCTRASVEELNRLLAQCNGRVAAQVVFFQPDEFPKDWAQTDLWRSAAAVPGVTVRADRNGQEARRFGAETSGFVVLFSSAGALLFKGGITAARGHIGDNAGVDLIVSKLDRASTVPGQTPVYGCGLLNGCGTKTEDVPLCLK